MKSFNDLFTWQSPVILDNASPKVLEHTDGSVSLAITWDGYKTNLKEASAIATIFKSYSGILHSLPFNLGLVIENHWLREYNNDLAHAYIKYGQDHAIRYHEISDYFRTSIAGHLSKYSMSNTIFCVLCLPASVSPFAGMFAKRKLSQTKQKAKQLLEIATELSEKLPGAEIASTDAYEALIDRCYHRDNAPSNSPGYQYRPNARFRINDRLADKPVWQDDALRLGRTYTKTGMVLDYPEAQDNWFDRVARIGGGEFHITQIIKPTDPSLAKRASSSETKKSLESASAIGGEDEAAKVRDHNAFRNFVASNQLSVFGTCYIFKIHSDDKEELDKTYRRVRSSFSDDEGMLIRDQEEEVQRVYWRVSMPGQGYKTPFLRPDDTWLVASMAPILSFSSGDAEQPQMLRLTKESQLAAFSYPEGGTNQAATAAKTGGGKGVGQVAQIVELYPLGVNFLGAEVGTSYEWTAQAFEGDYFHLDPNTTVVNPFPDFKMANKGSNAPLDADIASTTVAGLTTLLIGPNQVNVEHHVNSVAEQVMQAMYAVYDEESCGFAGPTLETYHACAVEALGDFSGEQQKACQAIIDNLDSFLATTAGQRFTGPSTINFDSGLVFVNFKPLMENKALAKFMLVFIALRYKQIAFANSTPCRIVLDELHEFTAIDMPLVNNLIRQLTRMGRKEAGAFHGISQEVLDLNTEDGVLNQITNKELLFMGDGHDEIAEIFKLRPRVLERWKSYLDPEQVGRTLNYRQCMRIVGQDAFDLHMTFPEPLLHLAHSSPKALKIKEQIGQTTNDVFERLKLFREQI